VNVRRRERETRFGEVVSGTEDGSVAFTSPFAEGPAVLYLTHIDD
jgi:hypothetical protein